MPSGKQQATDTLKRHWALLQAIPRQPRMATATDLQGTLTAAGYAVTKRTVERDLQTLSGSFALVSNERSKPFGWSWKKDAPAFTVPGLSPAGALAFHLTQKYLEPLLPVSMLRALAPHFELADKVLGEETASPARSWMKKVRVVHPGQLLLPPKVDSNVYAAITEALLNERQIKTSYAPRGEGKSKDYTLHPLGLVQRGPVSYLVATAYDYEDVRLYAVHRFSGTEVLDAPVRKLDFDLDAYITSGALGFGNGELIKLEAMFDEDASQHLYETPLSKDQTIDAVSDGRFRLRASIPNTPQLFWWLLSFGKGVEVRKPVALRRKVVEAVQAMARTYSSSQRRRKA